MSARPSNTARRLRRGLTGPATYRPGELFTERSRAFVQSFPLVRLFYVLGFYLHCLQWTHWTTWVGHTRLAALWPVAWFEPLGMTAPVVFMITGGLTTALLTAWNPRPRSLRIAAAVFLWLQAAHFNSFGSTMHGWHVFLWTATLFCLLPTRAFAAHQDPIAPPHALPPRVVRETHLRVFWSVQAATLLFYSMSGAFKLAAGVAQALAGEVGTLHPEALARHIAHRLMEGTPAPPPLGPWAVDHPHLIWPCFIAAVYLETLSFVAAFRPRLHRLWGLLLIAMHLGVMAMMGIEFSWQILFIGLVLVASPFTPPGVRLRDALADLPLLGDAARAFSRARRRGSAPPV